MQNRIVARMALACAAIAALTMLVPAAAETPAPPAGGSTMDKYVEMLRSNVQAEKKEILTEALALTDAEGKTFWPIYREYETELAGWGDQRYNLIKQYGKAYNAGVVSDDIAKDLGNRWLNLAKDRQGLMEKYYKKLSKSLSPMRASQFLQAEHQLNLLTDLAIASEVPFLQKSK